jgi:hypothetical protein
MCISATGFLTLTWDEVTPKDQQSIRTPVDAFTSSVSAGLVRFYESLGGGNV